jgi:hypothetical protein
METIQKKTPNQYPNLSFRVVEKQEMTFPSGGITKPSRSVSGQDTNQSRCSLQVQREVKGLRYRGQEKGIMRWLYLV